MNEDWSIQTLYLFDYYIINRRTWTTNKFIKYIKDNENLLTIQMINYMVRGINWFEKDKGTFIFRTDDNLDEWVRFRNYLESLI